MKAQAVGSGGAWQSIATLIVVCYGWGIQGIEGGDLPRAAQHGRVGPGLSTTGGHTPLLESPSLSSRLRRLCNYGIGRRPLPGQAFGPSKPLCGGKDLVAWGRFPGVSEETWHPQAACFV